LKSIGRGGDEELTISIAQNDQIVNGVAINSKTLGKTAKASYKGQVWGKAFRDKKLRR